ncbi:hypothetical protein ACRRTK_016412 [Alexandromys fortis]
MEWPEDWNREPEVKFLASGLMKSPRDLWLSGSRPGGGGPGVHKDAASWPRSGEGVLRRGSHPPVVRLRKRRESQEPGLPGPGALRPGLRLQEAGWRERPARGWEKPELLQRGVPGCSELSPPLRALAAAPALRQCGSRVARILQPPLRLPGRREGGLRPSALVEGATC